MSTKFEHIASISDGVVCNRPALGARVADYFVDLLNESMAEAVESHLADCVECQERYLTLLRVQAAARKKRRERGKNNGRGKSDAEVAHVLDIAKGKP